MAFDAYPKTVRAHFDGKVIVPDEALDLAPNVPLQVTIQKESADSRTVSERLAAMDRLYGRIKGKELSDSAFDRDTLYRD